jgi:hypothetical protein
MGGLNMRQVFFSLVSIAVMYSIWEPEGQIEKIILITSFFASVFGFVVCGFSIFIENPTEYKKKINNFVFIGFFGSLVVTIQYFFSYLDFVERPIKIFVVLGLAILTLAFLKISLLYKNKNQIIEND